jgi:hypothetical protein
MTSLYNSGKFKTMSAPRPDDLVKFLDNPISNRGMSNFSNGAPPFRPVATLRGGSGGGFGTGGGFGSTGGFHTMRLAPWEEPSIVPLDPHAPPLVEQIMPKEKPSQWAPSVCATAVAHSVNQLRAELEGSEKLRAVVDPSLVAPPIQPSDGGPMLIMVSFLKPCIALHRIIRAQCYVFMPGMEGWRAGIASVHFICFLSF